MATRSFSDSAAASGPSGAEGGVAGSGGRLRDRDAGAAGGRRLHGRARQRPRRDPAEQLRIVDQLVAADDQLGDLLGTQQRKLAFDLRRVECHHGLGDLLDEAVRHLRFDEQLRPCAIDRRGTHEIDERRRNAGGHDAGEEASEAAQERQRAERRQQRHAVVVTGGGPAFHRPVGALEHGSLLLSRKHVLGSSAARDASTLAVEPTDTAG